MPPISDRPYICDNCGRVMIQAEEEFSECPICGDSAQFDISNDE